MRRIIGIDGGAKTGVAIVNPDAPKKKEIEKLITTDFWGVMDIINDYRHNGYEVIVGVENPDLIKPLYNKKVRVGKNYIPTRTAVKAYAHNPKILNSVVNQISAISQSVGKVKRESTLLIEFLTRANIEFYQVKPASRKWDKGIVKQLGYFGQSSEHSRDGLKMAYCVLSQYKKK